MVAKLHFRKLKDGRILVQGVVPHDLLSEVEFDDSVVVADIVPALDFIDKTEDFKGLSNISILEEDKKWG